MFKKHLKDYFIPHEENNYAPHGLQKAAMIGMLFLVVLSFTATNVFSFIWMSSEWMVGAILPAVIVDLTNQERGADSLGVLSRSEVLDAAAKLKADDMAKNEYFAHYSPDGISPWYWFGQVSYNFVHAGENLAVHFTDSDEVVEAWMDSPSHRENIMNGNYTEIGVGTAKGTYEGFPTVFVVQLFGTPAASIQPPPTPEVAGESTEIAQVEEDTEQDEEVLAESVSISENVTVVEAEPVATEVEETSTTSPTLDEGQIVVSSSTDATTTMVEAINTPIIADMVITDMGAILYSDFISTSTNKVAASATAGTTQGMNDQAPFFLELMTQPHKILQIVYITIGLFVLGTLLLSILIEIRRQQPVQIAYGVGLMTIMLCLFYIHTVLSSGAFIL